MTRKLFLIFAGMLAAAFALEMLCSALPVSHGWRNALPTQANPLIRYLPNTNFTYSRGWKLENVVRGKFNNLGYVSRHDYQFDPSRRTIVLIGDSFAEAAMIPDGHRVHELLHEKFNPEYQVVSLSQSGADLADYLEAERYALGHFNVSALIFLINPGDIEDAAKPKKRGFWFSRMNDGRIHTVAGAEIGARNLVYSSKLLSYVFVNLKFGIGDFLEQLTGSNGVPRHRNTAGPTRTPVFDSVYWTHFLEETTRAASLRSGERPKVFLAFDADRQAVYKAENDAYLPAYANLPALGEGRPTRRIYLSRCFSEAYGKGKERFDYGQFDAHWNILGHRAVSECLGRALREQ